MSRHATLSTALVVAGIALLVAPVLVPVEPVLSHDTRRGTLDDAAELRADGYEVIAYENLSERGKELYVRTLRNGGEYHVAQGSGAPEFAYPSRGELADVEDHRERETLRSVVIERPPDADLPPADEPMQAAEHRPERRDRRDRDGSAGRATPTDGRATPTASVEERRTQIARYDLMTTGTERPPLTATAPLLRLLSALGGVLALGTGGYLRSLPP